MKFLVVLLVTVLITATANASTREPILIIPGVMGSQLMVKDTNSNLCRTGSRSRDLWLNVLRLFCWKTELPLKYDNESDTFTDEDGIIVTVPGFGNTDTVERLNLFVPYFHKMVDYFVDRGYTRGKDIRAAPYDWRLAADELLKRGYFRQLKQLVETMYEGNSNKKINLVVHSMGGLVSHYFLTEYTLINQTWKDKYISNYITLSTPWAGSGSALKAVISGPLPYPFPFSDELVQRPLTEIIRTFESLPWLFPHGSVWNNTILATTLNKVYTTNNYQELFTDIGHPQIYTTYERVRELNSDLPPPNVTTHCFYGTGEPTPQSLDYSYCCASMTQCELDDIQIVNGDGDGKVNIESSSACQKWKNMPDYVFEEMEFPGVDHRDMVKDDAVLEKIAEIVKAPAKKGIIDKIINFFDNLFG